MGKAKLHDLALFLTIFGGNSVIIKGLYVKKVHPLYKAAYYVYMHM